MNDISSSERSKPWELYTSSNPSPGFDGEAAAAAAPWKSFGTSMNAISFGFVATAILISMFLIMAIFEHLFKPSHEDINASSLESGTCRKLGNPETAEGGGSTRSVVMPGQKYATYIAQPAPFPCQREGIYWPSHQHHFHQI